MLRPVLSLLVLALSSAVAAVSSSGSRLLVVLEDVAEKDKYSKFLGDLKSRGFDITYSTPKADSLQLFRLGRRTYDHAIFFPTKGKGLGPNLTPNLLLQFVKENGNILVALSSQTAAPSSIVSLLHELDLQLPAERTGLVVDHFNYDAASAPDLHDVVLVPAPAPVRPGVAAVFASPDEKRLLAFPRGVAQTLSQSPLLNPVVRGPRTTYSYDPKEQAEAVDPDQLFAAGQQLSLVSAVQARNSARVAVVGSVEMLADKWFDAKVKPADTKDEVATYNREFASGISAWAFQELGVLRVNWIEHHLNEAGASNVSNPRIYRVNNDVTYTISLSQYDGKAWGPFAVPADDELQLEFSMLSPFHRLPLKAAALQPAPKEATAYSVSFRTPDQHGIFNFKVNYKRPFLTNIDTKDTVSVRHMAHDEWPRSYVISGAWPWLTGIGATVTGWLAFVLVFMFSAPAKKASAAKKTQ